MLEVENVRLEFRRADIRRQWSPRDDDDASESVIREEETQTFPAHETSGTHEQYRKWRLRHCLVNPHEHREHAPFLGRAKADQQGGSAQRSTPGAAARPLSCASCSCSLRLSPASS